MLLDEGVPVDVSARGDGGTPLVVALFWGHREVTEVLAEHGVHPRNLRAAAGLGRLDLVEELVAPDGRLAPEAGAHRAYYRPHSGFPDWRPSDDPQEVLDEALAWAARSDRVEVLEPLVARGARPDADVYRGSALMWAAASGRAAAVRRLLELGADPSGRSTFGGPTHGEGVTPAAPRRPGRPPRRRAGAAGRRRRPARPRRQLRRRRPTAGPSTAATPRWRPQSAARESSPAGALRHHAGPAMLTEGPSATRDETQAALRRDIRELGVLLGRTIVRQEGREMLDLVERVRQLVRTDRDAAAAVLAEVDPLTAIRLVRAFSTYFHLANVAEQVHRARELQATRAERGSWLAQAVERITSAAVSPGELSADIAHLAVRPVFTAHPTEAARRTVLTKLRQVATLLDERERAVGETAQRRVERRLEELIELLWQSDELRVAKPDVVDEARNAVYYLDELHRNAVPDTLRDAGRRARPPRRRPARSTRARCASAAGSAATATATPTCCRRPRSTSSSSSTPTRCATRWRSSTSCAPTSPPRCGSRASPPSSRPRWPPTSSACPSSTSATGA